MPPDPRADAARFVRIGRTVCEDARQHIERTSLMVQWSKEAARTSQHRLAVSWDMLVRARSAWPWEDKPPVRGNHRVPSV